MYELSLSEPELQVLTTMLGMVPIRLQYDPAGYWTLITCMFLHGGWLHLAMNSYVLYALGKFFNKLIGNSRFLILYFASGVCGSLASILISKPSLSVGASGALWGLFGLSAALIVKPSGFLPDAVRENLRNVTVFNLVINIAISFSIPFIDKWAHFGGGIAGFLIGLAFVLEPEYRARKLVHRALASAFVVLAALSLGAQWYYAKPWVLMQPVKLVDQPLFDGKMTISVPSFLKLKKTTPAHSQYGEFGVDPYEIDVFEESIYARAGSTLEMRARGFARDSLSGIDYRIVSVKNSKIGNFETTALLVEFNAKDENGNIVADDIRRFWVWAQKRDSNILYVSILVLSDTPPVLVDKLEQIIESVRLPIRI